jgi:hypothetical protein
MTKYITLCQFSGKVIAIIGNAANPENDLRQKDYPWSPGKT